MVRGFFSSRHRRDCAAALHCHPAGGRGSSARFLRMTQGFRLRPAGYAETGTPWASVRATPPVGGVRYSGGRKPAVFLSPASRRGGRKVWARNRAWFLRYPHCVRTSSTLWSGRRISQNAKKSDLTAFFYYRMKKI